MSRFPVALIIGAFLFTANSRLASAWQVRDAPDIVQADVYPAEPFGVGKVVFRLSPAAAALAQTGAIQVDDADGRLLYPAVADGLLARAIGASESNSSQTQTVWFLFHGPPPASITVSGFDSATVVPRVVQRRPRLSRVPFQQWWRAYNAQTRNRIEAGDYPPIAETYLTSMLGYRLGLEPPVLSRVAQQPAGQLQQTFDLMFDVESIRSEAIREMMAGQTHYDGPLVTLPPPVQFAATRAAAPPVGYEPELEAIAAHVPVDCFYLRFGSWDNQLWLKRLMAEYAGDLGRMIQLRGHVSSNPDKMLAQLALESGQIDDLLGGNLIADVAVIGHDFYLDDGASIGVLFQAKSALLGTNFASRRKAYARRHRNAGVTLEDIEIAGQPVSILSTPNNRIRSFYAVDGEFHLLTTSRRIAEEFLMLRAGEGSLASSAEFRQARQILPLTRDDTVFAFLSSDFFQNLLSPRYQVELARRNRAIAQHQVLALAKLAAFNESYRQSSLEELIQAGFLPRGFATEAQYARPVGGDFVPISDVNIETITAQESQWLARRLSFFGQELNSLDPIFVGVQRFELGEDVERIVMDARIAPFGKGNYSWLGQALGAPLEFEIATDPQDLINLQASLGSLPIMPTAPHQLFAAVQGDVPPKSDLQPANLFDLLNLLRTTPGYVGAWPKPGYLDILPALGGQPDNEGFTYSRLLDLWRLQEGEFSVISFDRQRLEALRENLHAVESARPAQVRLRVGNLAESNVRDWANSLYFQRSWETSVANVRLMNALIQQFRIPPETAKEQAEGLLSVSLICPLGGEYHLQETPSGRATWWSDRWPALEQPQVPADYTAPPLEWFRGLELDVRQLQTQFVVHAALDMKRAESSSVISLPSFDLFKGFGKVEELPKAEAGQQPQAPTPVDK